MSAEKLKLIWVRVSERRAWRVEVTGVAGDVGWGLGGRQVLGASWLGRMGVSTSDPRVCLAPREHAQHLHLYLYCMPIPEAQSQRAAKDAADRAALDEHDRMAVGAGLCALVDAGPGQGGEGRRFRQLMGSSGRKGGAGKCACAGRHHGGLGMAWE